MGYKWILIRIVKYPMTSNLPFYHNPILLISKFMKILLRISGAIYSGVPATDFKFLSPI